MSALTFKLKSVSPTPVDVSILSPSRLANASLSEISRLRLQDGRNPISVGDLFEVSGSDLGSNATTQRLLAAGAKVYQGHDAEYAKGVDVVVTSTAVREDNPEVVAAR